MKKIQKHIEIVRSSIIELSSLSQESCDAMYAVLSHHYQSVNVSVVNNLADLKLLVSKQPDLVFVGMKFVPVHAELGAGDPDKIWITKYLDDHGIAYTGSNQLAHELELNKPFAKQRVLEAGLMTSPYLVIKNGESYLGTTMPLQYPLFVKPASLGAGQGIDDNSIVHNLTDLHAKSAAIGTNYSADILVEEYLVGREFSVAILKDEFSGTYLAMPIELVAADNAQGDRILSQEAKSSNEEVVLAVRDPLIRERVTGIALGVFMAIGARDYGRIDIRLDAAGVPNFLEANLLPSLIRGYGSFPKACYLNRGLDYETMLLQIVRLGLAHQPVDNENTTTELSTLFGPLPTANSL